MRRLATVMILAACLGASPAGPWRAKLGVDHPLVGRIVEVRGGEEIEPAELVARLAGAHFVLLGEKHDNPDHHALQAWIIAELARRGARPAIAFEMLRPEQRDALIEHRRAQPKDVDGLAEALDWRHSGWPDWSLYRPIFEAAIEADLPIEPAELSRAQLERVREGGLSSAGETLTRAGLDRPLSAEARARLAEQIEASHCGMVPVAAVDAMLGIQRARDAQLAISLGNAATVDGAVLIAGSGHAQRDLGVPLYLQRVAPGRSTAVVSFVEVADASLQPADYLGAAAEFDYVWFTPRTDDLDPCERFQEELEKLRETS